MYLVMIGNKSGKGSGEKKIYKFESEKPNFNKFLADFESLSTRHNKVRLYYAERWACTLCNNICITKVNEVKCSLCRRVSRVLLKSGEATYRDHNHLLDGLAIIHKFEVSKREKEKEPK